MNSRPVFRGLSKKSWISQQTSPQSVSSKAFLRRLRDEDGISVFDDPESCSALQIVGVAEIAIGDLLSLENPLSGTRLRVCYDDASKPHHLVIENVPFADHHPNESETVALNIAMKAKIRDWD